MLTIYQGGWPPGCHPSEITLVKYICPKCGKEHRADIRILPRNCMCFNGCYTRFAVDKKGAISNILPPRGPVDRKKKERSPCARCEKLSCRNCEE